MRFADYAKVFVQSGKGGAGSVHFRREKYVPRGGPDGGDGGRGGNVVLKGNQHLNTLLDLRYRKYVKAAPGDPGKGAMKTGKDGKDEVLDVPLGTVVFEEGSRKLLGEITEHGQSVVVARGGRGGLGNVNFKSATNQAPKHAQPGEAGDELTIELELKLLADVGLVGFPNAGKSTLLSVLSAAKPKIADYPFTTLEPNLGVVQLEGYRSFVMADIPGIIEDAHEGKGLGMRFLRHIERNEILLYVISCESDIEAEFEILQNELREYREDLLHKRAVIAVTKLDLVPGYELEQDVDLGIPTVSISSAAGVGLTELKELLWAEVQNAKDEQQG